MRDLDMLLSMVHEQSSNMLKVGIPIEMMMDRFSGWIPKSILKDITPNYEHSKILNKSK